MIEPTAGLPPHIALLLNEEFELSDVRATTRKLKGLLRELKDQADPAHVQNLIELDQAPAEFRAVLSGGLDVFGHFGACQELSCRLSYATQISRSIALMSDKVIAHDYFFERIHDLRSRPTNEEIAPLVADLMVLKLLKPLIEAGILRFVSPFMPLCGSCMGEFDARVQALADEVLASLTGEMQVERNDEFVFVDLGSMYDPSIVVHLSPAASQQLSDEDLKRYMVEKSVRSILWDARNAGWITGSVFSNSGAGIAALLSEDGHRIRSSELRAFAAQRAAELPWVSGLTIEQTLDLRAEATGALPSLREFMARRLSASAAGDAAGGWEDNVAELREQAAEVRAELAIATARSISLRRNATGILGLGVSAVCFAAEGPGPALGGLLATLGLIHSLPTTNSTHAQTLRTRPGYVLVAAQDILQHAT